MRTFKLQFHTVHESAHKKKISHQEKKSSSCEYPLWFVTLFICQKSEKDSLHAHLPWILLSNSIIILQVIATEPFSIYDSN